MFPFGGFSNSSPTQTTGLWSSDGKVLVSGKRFVCVPVAVDVVIEIVRRGYHTDGVETIEGVPTDATYVGSYSDNTKSEAYLIFEHVNFDEVPNGDFIPTKRVVIRKLNP